VSDIVSAKSFSTIEPPTHEPSCGKFSPESGGVTTHSSGWIDGQW